MRKLMTLVLLVSVSLLPIGCSSLRGFCSRGSLFPSTRQDQITAPFLGEQIVYQTSADACSIPYMNACDPCSTSPSAATLPGPVLSSGY
ncbi:MAG: hypothetical protein LBQ54_05775 [Planctomycetaceae bacterium]|nr:hypothetical protein [Planctomycetaceae bacterium]